MKFDAHVWSYRLHLARERMRQHGIKAITDPARPHVDPSAVDIQSAINRARSRANLRNVRGVK